MGGDLSPDRLLLAYRNGIFPWYESDPILWWSPDPRMVLYPQELKISKSTRSLMQKNVFEFTVNKSFSEVIHQCKHITRAGQDGTWITEEVERSYSRMHELGYAQSAEVWQNGGLVGGLYGLRIGKVFFGESMFSLVSNASRYAFTKYVQLLNEQQVELIDCQVETEYLRSFGARLIPRSQFIVELKKWIGS
jgi:leucyl/phenylalanyl-tRNA--protein transferase